MASLAGIKTPIMTKRILTALFSVITAAATAQVTTVLAMNELSFKAKDSIEFNWNGTKVGMNYPLATMHLWIDDLQTGQRWKFRYPIVNGEAAGALAISEDIRPGTYAFNFLGANHHLEIFGRMRNVRVKLALNYKTGNTDTIAVYEKPGSVAQNTRYSLMSRAGLLYDSVLRIDDEGHFRIPPLIFGDTARLAFNLARERSSYMMEMVTPLDSVFTPFFTKTVFITVKGKDRVKKADTAEYQFSFKDPYPTAVTLEEVKVSGLTKLQKYEKENVSLWFRSLNSRTYDGLDNNQLSTYVDLWDFFRSHIVGLTVSGAGFQRSAMWRGQPVVFFLDEVPIDPNLITIHPADVAMVRAFPPGSMMTMQGPGGAVAIYSKRGGGSVPRSNFSFSIIGYTQGASSWKTQ